MNLKDFNSLRKRDFENGAVLDEIAAVFKEVELLQEAVAKMSHRKCWNCAHVAYYLDAITPHCLCEKCGSQDTRLIAKPQRQ